MNRNVKRMFLLTTLIVLLVGITALSASDVTDNDVDEISSSHTIEDNQVDEIPASDNKNIETTKNIKQTPESSVDYYVSDTDGNDENDGSQTSPFKTINTAISKTDSDNVYNIHILEGTYKGEGNTNLTVNGEYYINFIGEGVNKTIIDGELNYSILYDEFSWESSEAWLPWTNCSGNWFMNITAGNGSFEVTNFRIQNCYSLSGTNIAASPTATIDNYANLKATDMYFYHNSAGVGAGIRNGYKDFNPNATLYVDNCTFEANLKATTYGNFGAAVYNNATATINNSYIIDNYARWGCLTTDKSMYVYNTYIARNIAYDGTSTYKNGPSIYANTGSANYNDPYKAGGLLLHVENCTFEDNQQVDINYANISSEIIGNVFNHSTGIVIAAGVNASLSQVIANNQFIDMQPSTLTTSMTSNTKPSWGIYSLGSIPLLIENNTIDVKDTKYGYGIYVTNNATINNNTVNNYIYLNGKFNNITNNYVEAPVNFVIQAPSTATNNTIVNNTLYSITAKGDVAVNVPAKNTVQDNIPEIENSIVTDETYSQFFDENGVLKTDVVENRNKITFSGELTNRKFIFDDIKLTVSAEPTAKLVNTTIITQNNASVYFQNIKIENANNNDEYAILFNSTRNTMQNVSVKINTDKVLQAVKIEDDFNTITNTTINMTAAAGDTVWYNNYAIGNVPTAGIFIRSSDNLVNNSKLYIDATRVAEGSYAPSVDGIDIQSKDVGQYVSGNEIRSSTRINVNGGSYVYGLNVARAVETITNMTYFNVSSNNCAYAIQLGDSNDTKMSGYLYSYADSQAYGAYITAMATGKTYNTNFSKLYIQDMNASEVFGIYVDGASGVELSNATYVLSGGNVKVVDMHKDWMANTPEDIFINALKITVTNDNDDSEFMTISNSNNVTITNSNMTSTAGKGINLTNVTDATVVGNYILAANLIGGNAAVTSTNEAVIEDNTPTIALLTDETYSSLFDENANYISDATVISLAGDLHNKDLIFDKTTTVNITNVDDYTIYNGTVKLSDLDPENPSTTQTTINVIGINFDNTNKEVFMDEMNDKTKRTVKFMNSTFNLNGEDITGFTSNEDSPTFLEVSTSNITASGEKVVLVDFHVINKTINLFVNSNNIDITAAESAMIINASKAAVQFTKNNITQTAVDSTIANYDNCTISSYNFRYNNIISEGNSVTVLKYFRNDSTSGYVSDNNMTLTSPNPITAINLTGAKSLYIQNNKIIVNAENGEVPVIYANATTTVQNNYILAYDVAGNDAVSTKGTNTKNSPNATTPTTSTITVDDVKAALGETVTVTATVTGVNNTSVPRGTVTFVDNTGKTLAEVNVTDGQASFTISYAKPTQLEVTATFTGNKYFTDSECVFNISFAKKEINITLDEVTLTPGKTTTLTAKVVDSEGNNVNTGKVVFKVNGKTVKDANGKVVYSKVIDGVASVDYLVADNLADTNVTISVKYSGNSQYDAAEVEETVSVAKKQATVTIDEIPEVQVGSTVNITANVVDADNNPVTEGKVVFKINGKTLKDANGKVIYAKVVNGVAKIENYDLSSFKAKTYDLQAVFTSPVYDKTQANTTLTVIN